MVKAPAASCVNHRRRDKVAACGVCGHALCADCIVHTPVGVKCRRCTGVKGAGGSTGSHVSAGAARPETAAAGTGRGPKAAALVAGGLVVLALVAFGLTRGDSDPVRTQGLDAGLAAPLTERVTEFVGPGGQRLGGTLTLPGAGDGRNVPAVLIVPGLGAIDRNSVTSAATPDVVRDALLSSVSGIGTGTGDPLYKDLSESLAKSGIASFRYEKRGTAPSPLRAGQKLSFDDEVGDARAALDLLAQRQEVGTASLAVLGHDSGGLVAMRLAGGNPRVRAVVAVSTPGRPLVDVMADDLARARGAAAADQFRSTVATLTASGRSPAPETLPELLRPVFAPGHDAYLTTLFSLDPATEAAAVGAPVLLVRGGGDKSVTAVDTDRLSAALRSGSEVMVGSAEVDHNLSLPAAGHQHSNTPSAPVSLRDADVGSRLTGWVKARLTA